jgi:hypothetical protein
METSMSLEQQIDGKILADDESYQDDHVARIFIIL